MKLRIEIKLGSMRNFVIGSLFFFFSFLAQRPKKRTRFLNWHLTFPFHFLFLSSSLFWHPSCHWQHQHHSEAFSHYKFRLLFDFHLEEQRIHFVFILQSLFLFRERDGKEGIESTRFCRQIPSFILSSPSLYTHFSGWFLLTRMRCSSRGNEERGRERKYRKALDQIEPFLEHFIFHCFHENGDGDDDEDSSEQSQLSIGGRDVPNKLILRVQNMDTLDCHYSKRALLRNLSLSMVSLR